MNDIITVMGSLRSLSSEIEEQTNLMEVADQAELTMLRSKIQELRDTVARLSTILELENAPTREDQYVIFNLEQYLNDIKKSDKSSPIIAQTFNLEFFERLSDLQQRVNIAAALIEKFDSRSSLVPALWRAIVANQGIL